MMEASCDCTTISIELARASPIAGRTPRRCGGCTLPIARRFSSRTCPSRPAAASASRSTICSASSLTIGAGGYCFEHNTLFAAALRDLGFAPITQLGRVRRGPPERWCRTHMVLRIPIGNAVWMADVGFGSIGLIEPMPLRDGATSDQGGFEYALRREGPLVDSVDAGRGVDDDLYEFSRIRRRRGTWRSPIISRRRIRTRCSGGR